jgi:hypothetical protein
MSSIAFWPARCPTSTTSGTWYVANILHHLPFGRELMHLGLQTMAYRHGMPEKYRPDITDMWWDRLDGTLPDPARCADLPGGAEGTGSPGCAVAENTASSGDRYID